MYPFVHGLHVVDAFVNIFLCASVVLQQDVIALVCS